MAAGQITTTDDIKQLGTIMSIWAHPDDETFLAGGLLAAAVANGQTVVCATATKGEAGSHDPVRWPVAQIGAVRAQELKNALEILGVRDHFWLDCIDGCCEEVSRPDVVDKLTNIAEKYQPDTFITFGPEGWTGHPDHCVVSAWAKEVADRLPKRPTMYRAVVEENNYQNYLKTIDEALNVFFHIDKPPIYSAADCNICFKLPKDFAQKKAAALRAMTSQTEKLFSQFDDDFITDAWSVEAFVKTNG